MENQVIKDVLNTIYVFMKENLVNIIIAFVLIAFYREIKNIINKILNRFYDRLIIGSEELKTFVKQISNFFVNISLIYLIVITIGVNFSGLATILMALSLVLGFAFQGILSNFFGGVILILFRPFKVGDVIEFNGTAGTVKKVEIYYTTILTFQNEFALIPNGQLIKNRVRNLNVEDIRRLDITVSVGYSTNILEVKTLLLDIINRREDLFALDMPISIGMFEIGASSLNFDIKVYCKPGNMITGKYYLNETIKPEFDAAGIELPYNIIDLQVNKNFNSIEVIKK